MELSCRKILSQERGKDKLAKRVFEDAAAVVISMYVHTSYMWS